MKISGIYKISFTCCDKVYIGSSVHLLKRKQEHFRTLKKQEHFNQYLQRAFDKNGEEKCHIEFIEFCEVKDLREKEQYWINFYESYKKDKGYNLVKDVTEIGTRGYKYTPEQLEKHVKILEEKCWSKKRKDFKFLSPEDELVEIHGLRQFCFKNKLHYKSMLNVHSGVNKIYKGWTKYHEDGSKTNLDSKGKNYIIIQPNGEEIKINNLNLFCKKNLINSHSLRKGCHCKGFILKN